MNTEKNRLVICMCCDKQHPIETPIIDVGQEIVYCDDCYNECSYVFINGDTIYYHKVRDIISKILLEVKEKTNTVHMSKEEAIEFAKRYLNNRRNDYTVETYFKDPVDSAKRAWDIAVEYILLDIIPYLYGDALD